MKNIFLKSILIAFVYFAVLLINACCSCKDYSKPKYFDIEGIDAMNYEYQFEADTLFRLYPYSSDSIKKKTYGIGLMLLTRQIAATMVLPNFTSAYACKCNIDNEFLTDTISEVHIKTLIDFDAAHLKGSNVDEYFKFLQVDYDSLGASISYNQIYQTPFLLSPHQVFYFYLNEMPSSRNDIQFEVSLTTKKGKTYLSKTKAVSLF